MSICECGQVSVPLGKVSVQVFGTIHGVTACGPSDRHWKDRAEKAEAAIARVREVCSQSRAVVSRGCSCHADECSGKCGAGKPLAWDLDPADVLRALDGSNSPPVTSEIAGPLIDPDCRDGKHSSCVGGPCECPCHDLLR